MTENILKDLYSQKRYNEVVDMLKELFMDVFEKMLMYKNITLQKREYIYLKAAARNAYPKLIKNFILLESTEANADATYLDVINVMLSTYMFFKKEYKNNAEDEEVVDLDDIEFIEE